MKKSKPQEARATVTKSTVSYKKSPSGKIEKTVTVGKPKEMKMKSISQKEYFSNTKPTQKIGLKITKKPLPAKKSK
jgi:hypothetical protein